jgi:ethanolamine transporter EutH
MLAWYIRGLVLGALMGAGIVTYVALQLRLPGDDDRALWAVFLGLLVVAVAVVTGAYWAVDGDKAARED